jgi:hypothetical protein
MATVDLGQFETRVVGPPPVMRESTRLVHVVHVTESERPERCGSCGTSLPAPSGLYLLNGRVECPRCYEVTRASMKPARGFYPEERFGGEQLPRRRPVWRHRR